MMTEAQKAKIISKFTDADKPQYELEKFQYNAATSELKKYLEAMVKPYCDTYMKSDSYKDGATDTYGYKYCCDLYGFCGGMSGWLIFLIILLVLGGLAASGAAFFFFYWRRKMGGRDIEKDSEKSSTKSEYDISVDTY